MVLLRLAVVVHEPAGELDQGAVGVELPESQLRDWAVAAEQHHVLAESVRTSQATETQEPKEEPA